MRRSTALKKAAAAAVLLLLSLAAAYMSIMASWERSEEEETHRMFVEWMEEHRYMVFKKNIRRGLVLNVFNGWIDEELAGENKIGREHRSTIPEEMKHGYI